ncbi:ABC transporter substrate-binding protein [Kribbella sp. NPDC051952]|uniref:ABC transporter substrate-binding protein n=1 Tax=Kribbella sp. NPDC051952 TaxID=3154851 RepID=UPI0034396E45
MPEITRRRLLGLAGVGAATIAAPSLLTGCGSSKESTQVVFGATPDIAKAIEKSIARFNDSKATAKPVRVRLMPADSSQFLDQMRTQFQAGSADVDVFGGDISWSAQFAPNGWLADLSERFSPDLRAQHLKAAVDANVVGGKVYGVPWYWDAGLLYYRKDLLEKAGYTGPPATWDELQEMALKISRDTKTPFGFNFQGANYEGGTVNGIEYIRSAGGDVLTDGRVTIGSAEAVEGLTTERTMVTSGAAPAGVANYKEDECLGGFLGGKTVFTRQWVYLYGKLADKQQSVLGPDQVGVAELPVARAGLKPVNVGGGWNCMVNANSRNQDDAWKLVQFLTAAEQQKELAAGYAFLPTRPALYDDKDILKAMPVITLAKQAIQHTTVPPLTPYYSDMSLAMAKTFNASLRGAVSPAGAAEQLQTALEQIVAKSK